MANTKKSIVKKPVENTTTTVTNNASSEETVDTEKVQMQGQIDQLQAQLSALMAMMGNNTTTTPTQSNKMIPFVNLTQGILVLQGSRNYELREPFASRLFTEREALNIVANMPETIHQGYVYIADADFVKANDLEYTYKEILSEEQLKNLLNKDANYVVEVYKNASDGQKKIILDMVSNKKLNNEAIDANILYELGQLTGKDLIGIEPIEKEDAE